MSNPSRLTPSNKPSHRTSLLGALALSASMAIGCAGSSLPKITQSDVQAVRASQSEKPLDCEGAGRLYLSASDYYKCEDRRRNEDNESFARKIGHAAACGYLRFEPEGMQITHEEALKWFAQYAYWRDREANHGTTEIEQKVVKTGMTAYNDAKAHPESCPKETDQLSMHFTEEVPSRLPGDSSAILKRQRERHLDALRDIVAQANKACDDSFKRDTKNGRSITWCQQPAAATQLEELINPELKTPWCPNPEQLMAEQTWRTLEEETGVHRVPQFVQYVSKDMRILEARVDNQAECKLNEGTGTHADTVTCAQGTHANVVAQFEKHQVPEVKLFHSAKGQESRDHTDLCVTPSPPRLLQPADPNVFLGDMPLRAHDFVSVQGEVRPPRWQTVNMTCSLPAMMHEEKSGNAKIYTCVTAETQGSPVYAVVIPPGQRGHGAYDKLRIGTVQRTVTQSVPFTLETRNPVTKASR